jgi:hypothetical protein
MASACRHRADIVQRQPGGGRSLAVDALEQRARVPPERPLGNLQHDLEDPERALDVRPEVGRTVRPQSEGLDVEEEQPVGPEVTVERGPAGAGPGNPVELDHPVRAVRLG